MRFLSRRPNVHRSCRTFRPEKRWACRISVASSWYGFHAPAGTPKPIIDKINAEMVKALRTPEMRERFASIGADAISNSPAEFTAFVEAETAKWGKLIRAIGVKVE